MAGNLQFLIRDTACSTSGDDRHVSYSQSWSCSLGLWPSGASPNPPKDDQLSLLEPRQKDCDFLTMITAISTAYTSGAYIDMLALNDTKTTTIDGGKDFEVSRYTYNLADVSPLDQSSTPRNEKLIIKRMNRPYKRLPMTGQEMALFVRELSMLHHFRKHDNIVNLRGVGWFYDTLDDDDITPILEPSILLEEADGTLEHLLCKVTYLSFQTEMRICKDVASGLLSLHQHGIVHGDIKPKNVLIFPFETSEDGKPVFHYTTKISDFSLARAVGYRSCWFDWGTSGYIAPERHQYLSPEALVLTDVWSLGILFAAVTERGLDLVIGSDGTTGLGGRIMAQVHKSIRSSTWTPVMAETRQAMFDNTLQHEAKNRRLQNVVSYLESYFASSIPDSSRNMNNDIIPRFAFPDRDSIKISYENFKQVGGQVKDAIFKSLKVVSQRTEDVRRSSAFFELAVCAISGYADPYALPSIGLEYLRQSAVLGDIRARGVFYKIQKIIGSSEKVDVASQTVLDWLESAARQGHLVAMTDLCILDCARARLAHTYLASQSYDGTAKPISDEARTHKMAATGDLVGLISTVITNPALLNTRDQEQNVPLISATRYRQYDAVMCLLKSGALPSSTNISGENFLHHAWCFSAQQLQEILLILTEPQHLLKCEAAHKALHPTLGVTITWLGTPLECAVVMNNIHAVELFLGIMRGHITPNGLVLRRALLLAFRFHHEQIQRTIISFVTQTSALRDETLAPLYSTRWEYKGKNMSFLDAIVVGNISRTNPSTDFPSKWLRFCHLGVNHASSVQKSIWNFFGMVQDAKKMETYVDESISLALSEQWSDLLDALLECKAVITDGDTNRLRSLRHFTWHKVEGDSSPNDRVLERPPVRVSFADQIFYEEKAGTMLHRSILAGDRATFAMLVDCYEADPSLPTRQPQVAAKEAKQISTWSLIAHTRHCDLWFAHQLGRANLQFSLPFESPSCSKKHHFPPLLHALRKRRYGYAIWLMRNGASLEEKIQKDRNVLQDLLDRKSVDVGILEFLFPAGGTGGGFAFLPSDLKVKDGFAVFESIYAGHPISDELLYLNGEDLYNRDLVRNDVEDWVYLNEGESQEHSLPPSERPPKHEQKTLRSSYLRSLKSCLQYLFTVYPAVPDSPIQWTPIPTISFLPQQFDRHLSKVRIPLKRSSLLLESIRRGYGSSIPFIMTIQHYHDRALRNPVTCPFPRQTWLDVFLCSPLNYIRVRSWRKTTLWRTYGYLPSPYYQTTIIFLLLALMDYLTIQYLNWLLAYLWRRSPDLENVPDYENLWERLSMYFSVLFYLWTMVVAASTICGVLLNAVMLFTTARAV